MIWQVSQVEPLLEKLAMMKPCVCGKRHRSLERYFEHTKNYLFQSRDQLKEMIRGAILEQLKDITFDDLPPFAYCYHNHEQMKAIARSGLKGIAHMVVHDVFGPSLLLYPHRGVTVPEFFQSARRRVGLTGGLFSAFTDIFDAIRQDITSYNASYLAYLLSQRNDNEPLTQTILRLDKTKFYLEKCAELLRTLFQMWWVHFSMTELKVNSISLPKLRGSLPAPWPSETSMLAHVLDISDDTVLYLYGGLAHSMLMEERRNGVLVLVRYKFVPPKVIEYALLKDFRDHKYVNEFQPFWKEGKPCIS